MRCGLPEPAEGGEVILTLTMTWEDLEEGIPKTTYKYTAAHLDIHPSAAHHAGALLLTDLDDNSRTLVTMVDLDDINPEESK